MMSAKTGTNSRVMKKSAFSGIIDKPPEFALLPKEQLKIDTSYQRNLSNDRAKKIAAEWSWIACGVLKVSLREPGDWYVFDGQHRLAAARLRPEIKTLPCIIYEHETIEEEARGFLTQATQRPMYSVDKFKAQVIAGDPYAKIVAEVVEKANFTIRAGTAPGSSAVAAVNEMLRCVKQDEQAFRRLFPVLAEYAIEQKGLISEKFLRAAFYIEQQETLTTTARRKQLLTIPWSRFIGALSGDSRSGEATSPKSLARRFLHAFNYNRRTRLVIKGVNDDE